jgi:hypothetical protein
MPTVHDFPPPPGVEAERVAPLNSNAVRSDASARFVLYWMSRSARVEDNPALEYAATLANALGKPLLVLFVLCEGYPGASERQFKFMLEGLRHVSQALARREIPFVVRLPARTDDDPSHVAAGAAAGAAAGVAAGAAATANVAPAAPAAEVLPTEVICAATNAAAVVCDVGHLRLDRLWRESIAAAPGMPWVVEVEGDAVVPPLLASRVAEPTAATLRSKLQRLLPRFLHSATIPTPPVPLAHKPPQAKAQARADVEADVKAGAEVGATPEEVHATQPPPSTEPRPRPEAAWDPASELLRGGGVQLLVEDVSAALARLRVDRSVPPPSAVGAAEGGGPAARRTLALFLVPCERSGRGRGAGGGSGGGSGSGAGGPGGGGRASGSGGGRGGGGLCSYKAQRTAAPPSAKGAAKGKRSALAGTSRLSAYLHFGHISPRLVARRVSTHPRALLPEFDSGSGSGSGGGSGSGSGGGSWKADAALFLDELIVRRELSLNYVRTKSPLPPG